MLEFPEVQTIAAQLRETLSGKAVIKVLPPSKPHRFCFFDGDPADYDAMLRGAAVRGARGGGIYVEINFDNGKNLAFYDGVNARILPALPADYQLAFEMTGGLCLVFTVAMYGGFLLHNGSPDNSCYLASRDAISPLTPDFRLKYETALADCDPKLSAKAFLATQQRFPGIGNGVLQDILFDAGIHPKTKLRELDPLKKNRLRESVVSVLGDMTRQGGRDTEKDLYGRSGGYTTRLSRNTIFNPCPRCGGKIIKEAYLGGAVYYCPVCQPLSDATKK